MKNRALIFGVLVAGSALVLAADGVVLRRTFAVGKFDVYQMKAKTAMNIESPMGAQDMKLDMSNVFTVAYKTAKEKNCEVELKTTDMKIKGEGEMAGMMNSDNLPKEIVSTALLDPRNRLTDFKVKGAQDPMMQMMMSSLSAGTSNFFVELPDSEVKVGDTWKFKMPLTAPGMKTTGELTGKLAQDGGDRWIIHVSGELPFTMDMAEAAKASGGEAPPIEMVMSMTMTMDYKVELEKSSCRTLSLDGKIGTNMKIELPSMGMTIPGTGTTTMSATLKQ